MTHGRSIYFTEDMLRAPEQEGLEDVASPKGYLSTGFFKIASYGWKRCVDLAKQKEFKDDRHKPENNADTYALFGSSKSLIEFEF